MGRAFPFLAFVFLITTLSAGAQGPGIEVRGHLSANDTELAEGYFAVSQDAVIMARPGTPMHQWLKSHAGRTVRLVVEPAETR